MHFLLIRLNINVLLLFGSFQETKDPTFLERRYLHCWPAVEFVQPLQIFRCGDTTLSCCEAPEMLCGLQNLTLLLITEFWVNFSFK